MSATINYANAIVAAGTVDALTATVVPAAILSMDLLPLYVRTLGANTSTTPTLNLNAGGALPITKKGGDPLAAGDMDGTVILSKNIAEGRYELLNPYSSSGGGGSQDLEDTLTIDPSTGGIPLKSPDGLKRLRLDNADAILESDDALTPTKSGLLRAGFDAVNATVTDLITGDFVNVYLTPTGSIIESTAPIDLSGPSITKNGAEIATQTYVTSGLATKVSSVSGTLNRITSTGGITPVIDISASYVGQTSITTLGTIGTGTWQGTAITGTYIDNSAVTGKVLTGLNVTGSTISATDTILQAFGKLQNQVNGVLGGTIVQGLWNATTNSPALASGVGTSGYYYVVSVAGSTNLDGITDWKVGDWAIFINGAWNKVDNTDAVSSVNGGLGTVVITTTGTANRVTVSGGSGLTPTIDISATFEALLGKVANPLSQFAVTTSVQLAGVISDETGSGSLVFANTPTLVTPILGVATATSLGIGAVQDSELTVSKQATIVLPPTDTLVHFIGQDAKSLRLTLDTHNNAGAGGTAFLGRRSRGTAAVPLATQANDTIISLNGVGYGATGFGAVSTGLISIKANQLFNDTQQGTYTAFFNTPDNSTTAAEVFRSNGDGSVTISQASGYVMTPKVIGGTAVASNLALMGSNNAAVTTTAIATEFWIGNSGATSGMRLYQDNQLLIGAPSATLVRNPSSPLLGIVRIGQGTSWIDIGEKQSGLGTIWFNATTPSPTNYALTGNGTTTILNASTTAQIAITNSAKVSVTTAAVTFTPSAVATGAANTFTFTTPANTGQTAGTETIGFDVNMGATITHASNTTITTQRDSIFRRRTHDFATTGGSIGTAATVAITGAPIQTGNWNSGTPNLYAFWVQQGASAFDGDVKLNTAGNGLYIKEGTNATSGLATLVGGTLVVSTTKVTANSRIQLTGQGGTITNLGSYSVTARTAGTSFTISSSNVLDTNTVAWVIVEPA